MERNCNNCKHQVRRDGFVGCEKWECEYEFGHGQDYFRAIRRDREDHLKQKGNKKN